MAETKTPEEVAREWLSEESIPLPSSDMEELTLGLAALIRQRDEEHEARLREEREAAWKAAVEASRVFDGACRWANSFGEDSERLLLEAHRAYVADYLAAVEGRKEGEGDA